MSITVNPTAEQVQRAAAVSESAWSAGATEYGEAADRVMVAWSYRVTCDIEDLAMVESAWEEVVEPMQTGDRA